MSIRLLAGDCRDVLATLPDASVQCVVTSPPYYGLRDYGTATWSGGDAGCNHAPTGTDRGARDELPKPPAGWAERAQGYANGRYCTRCGARRIDAQLGLEATPDAYIASMVGVFREVRRVLRDDGTCWVNMGSSYSNGKGSNVTDQLNRLLEGGSVFFTNAGSVAVAGHCVGVAPQHEGAPNSELSGLLATERDGVEQWNQDLGKITDLFTYPGCAGLGLTPAAMLVDASNPEISLKKQKHIPVITSDSDAQSETIFAVLRPSCGGTCEDDETTFAVNQADEPSIRGNVRWHTAWHTFTREAFNKGVENIDAVDQAVALGNRLYTLAGLLRDFRVAKASEKQITLTSIHSCLTLAISDVRHLWFVLRCGSVVPYHKLLEDASRSANALLPKQELGIPWRLARALQEDGWILRSPIIWHKPNPMPESCRDRPTSAHEHVFLLTKRARYFYDADAVRETANCPEGSWGKSNKTYYDETNAGSMRNGGQWMGGETRNLRNVWTIATHAYPQSHFATYPPELVERCIKAGTSERGCCAQCGAPYVRQVETDYRQNRTGKTGRKDVSGSNGWDDGTYPNLSRISTTTGWAPSCACDAETQPCTVLDPFIGAGTTALVSDRLGRDCIGIDLNVAYTEMAMERVRADAPLFVDINAGPMPEHPEEQAIADLFAEAAE